MTGVEVFEKVISDIEAAKETAKKEQLQWWIDFFEGKENPPGVEPEVWEGLNKEVRSLMEIAYYIGKK